MLGGRFLGDNKRKVFIMLSVILVVSLGGGYFYLQNRPINNSPDSKKESNEGKGAKATTEELISKRP